MISPEIITANFICSDKPEWANARSGVQALDIKNGVIWIQKQIPNGSNWAILQKSVPYYSPVFNGVQSITGPIIDNADPANPTAAIAVDGVTITGDGSPGNPLEAVLPGGVQSVTGLNTNNADPQNPIVQIAVDGVTITGDGTPGNPLVGTPATEAFPVDSVYISVTSTNPATTLGYGTWVQFGQGRVLVGQDGTDTDFDTAEETGGSKTHQIKCDELPDCGNGENNDDTFLLMGA